MPEDPQAFEETTIALNAGRQLGEGAGVRRAVTRCRDAPLSCSVPPTGQPGPRKDAGGVCTAGVAAGGNSFPW